jgi:glucokinase
MNVPPVPAANSGAYLLGLDLGGTRLKALALTPDGAELARDTALTGGVAWQESVRACVAGIVARLDRPPLGLAVAAPGIAAPDERSILSMPGRLPGLEGLDWSTFLQSAGPVPVLNDAHAALLGEVWLGAAPGARDVILLTLGTGVGGAILAEGRLLRGHIGRAGHFGHLTVDSSGSLDIVGTPGSLEDAIGNHSLSARSAGRYTSTADLVADVARGNAEATAVWSRSIRDLAAGITSLINVVDPETVLIGGGIAEAGDALFAPLAAELDRIEWRPGGHRVRLARAQLGDWAGAYGAVARARQLLPSVSISS